MKLLLVETRLSGHHLSYLNSLIHSSDMDDIYVVVPESYDFSDLDKQHVFVKPFIKNGSPNYRVWIKEIKKVVANVRPDIIHFIYGDDLYRFFGIGIGVLKKYSKVVITYHQIRRSTIRDLAIRLLAKASSRVIVHTASLAADLKSINVYNVSHIEYPHFSEAESIDRNIALDYLDIKDTTSPLLLALGGTRQDKGLDLLLEALKLVSNPFHLIIAGKEESFKKSYIEGIISDYKNNVSLFLKFLSDEEFFHCLNAADIVCLPYRKSFDGASGPLGEGVALGKMIVGPNHGSLGRLIEDNHLGYTFESENIEALAVVLDEALSGNWKPDEKYKSYQNVLNPKRFQRDYMELYRSLTK